MKKLLHLTTNFLDTIGNSAIFVLDLIGNVVIALVGYIFNLLQKTKLGKTKSWKNLSKIWFQQSFIANKKVRLKFAGVIGILFVFLLSAVPGLVRAADPGQTSIVAGYLHDNLKLSDTTPTTRFTATDGDADDLIYQINWDTDADFAGASSAISNADAGFSNIDTPGDTSPFNSGETISYTWQTPLSNDTTYFYRVRAYDGGTYGDWSTTRSFTIDTSLTNNAWFQTYSDQFSTDTLDLAVVSGEAITNEVSSDDTTIDTSEATTDWTSTDSATLKIALDSSGPKQGSNSMKVSVNNYGAGTDGSCTVSASLNINTASCVGRSDADAINFSVTADTSAGGTAITVSSTPTGLAVGDEILIINLQGTAGDNSNVGKYETQLIKSIDTNTLTLFNTLTNAYDGTTQKIMVQRVPQYSSLTVDSTYTLTADTWDGTKNGILFFRVQGTLTNNGIISMNSNGFRGGTTTLYAESVAGRATSGTAGGGGGGGAGRGYSGSGGGGGSPSGGSGSISGGAGGYSAGGGGGGGGDGSGPPGGGGSVGGGGGGYYNPPTVYAGSSGSGSGGGGGGSAAGGGGGGAKAYTSYTNTSPSGLATIKFGGGAANGGGGGGGGNGLAGAGVGGSGGYGGNSIGTGGSYALGAGNCAQLACSSGGSGGSGNPGGGIIMIAANDIDASGGGTIVSNGGNGGNGGSGGNGGRSNYTYPACGGGGGSGYGSTGAAGGSVLLEAKTLTLGTTTGTGGSAGSAGGGGAGRACSSNTSSGSGGGGYAGSAGGAGQIAIEYVTSTSGSPDPSPTSTQVELPAVNSAAVITKSPLDLSQSKYIKYWIKSNKTGNKIRFSFGETDIDEQTYQITIASGDTWQEESIDISGITDADIDAVTKFAFTATSTVDTTELTFNVDNLRAPTTAIVTSTAITAANFYANANSWDELAFTDNETTGDVKYSIYYDVASTPTIVTDGALAGNSTGFDTSPVDLTGLTVASYPILYIRATLTNSSGSPILNDWTVTANQSPATPSLDLPVDTATNQAVSPDLKTTTTDNDTDYLRYKIELCENLGMTTNCQTFDQTSSQTGWSGQDAQTSTAYASGTQAIYSLQTSLTTGFTYYWRSYAIDPGGTNLWSSTQGTPYSFTVTNSPTPSVPYCEGQTNPSSITDLTPELSAIHNDGGGNAADYYQIQVNTAVGFDGTTMWDSGKTSMTSTANGVRSPDISYAGTALAFDGSTYYWRIKFWNVLGAEGSWSSTQNFSMNNVTNVPTLDLPADTATGQLVTPALKTTATDDDSDYLRYKIQVCENEGMTLNCNTYDQTSSQTGWSGQDTETSTAYTSGTQGIYTLQTPLATVTTYYWRSYAIDPAGANTWSATQSPVYSFTTSDAPTEATNCRISEADDDSSNTVMWTDVAGDENYYEVERSEDGGGWADVATGLAADTTSYQDSTITANHTYRYRVAPYFTGPVYGNWCYTDTLTQNLGSFRID
jgi:hypothetical protein